VNLWGLDQCESRFVLYDTFDRDEIKHYDENVVFD
jgi:hypothetical protein